jgi:hypothetical protein
MRLQLRLLRFLLLHPRGLDHVQPPGWLRRRRRLMRVQRWGCPPVRRHMPRQPVRPGQSVLVGGVLHRGEVHAQATGWRSMQFQLWLFGWMLLRRDMHVPGVVHRYVPPMTTLAG